MPRRDGKYSFRSADYAQAAFFGQANYRPDDAGALSGFLIDSF
jgi:hypothetical protein